MTQDPWKHLADELDKWSEAGDVATFWVRDDDAITRTDALDGFLDTCVGADVPVALAVIPRDADAALADAVWKRPAVHVLQHGWCHANHAPPGEKKTELGDHRRLTVVGEELASGRRRMSDLFEDRFLPVVAPPWNRIGDDVARSLSDWGYDGLSLFTPRNRTIAVEALVRVNTHVDIIDWKGTRGFRGDEEVLEQAIGHLEARRTGSADKDEPTGLITHHLVHDHGCREFIGRFLAALARHPAVAWPGIDAIFARV